MGPTYAINNNLIFFGGIGVERTIGYNEEHDINFVQSENKFNINVGVSMYFFEGLLGVTAEYDTAREAIGVGITVRLLPRDSSNKYDYEPK